jgi:hypothetical protein
MDGYADISSAEDVAVKFVGSPYACVSAATVAELPESPVAAADKTILAYSNFRGHAVEVLRKSIQDVDNDPVAVLAEQCLAAVRIP